MAAGRFSAATVEVIAAALRTLPAAHATLPAGGDTGVALAHLARRASLYAMRTMALALVPLPPEDAEEGSSSDDEGEAGGGKDAEEGSGGAAETSEEEEEDEEERSEGLARAKEALAQCGAPAKLAEAFQVRWGILGSKGEQSTQSLPLPLVHRDSRGCSPWRGSPCPRLLPCSARGSTGVQSSSPPQSFQELRLT